MGHYEGYILTWGGNVSDSSDSVLPVSADPAGADPDPAGPADVGNQSEDKRERQRGNPWDRFRFKRFGGLERRARAGPDGDEDRAE
jgi:hypothetical protein